MPLPDIKDVGIVAGFGLWGWPYHGLCSAGVIACAGGISKTIVTPAHGSAWLYDLGLPAITRTPAEIIADTAIGHEWRNYTMISGGVINGTQIEQIGSDSFVHVDASGVPWLIRMVYTYPNYTSNQVRITFSVVRFGLFGEGVKTPVQVIKDVQCHLITYSMYGYTYEGIETTLEDVWTNGSRALVSVGRTRSSTPPLKDLFSLLEVTFSGSGGVDGSGLVIAVAEIMQDTELSQGLPGDNTPLSYVYRPSNSAGYTGGSPTWTPIWNEYPIWSAHSSGASEPNGIGASDQNYHDHFTYARFAYYNSAGVPKVARIKKEYRCSTSLVNSTHTAQGTFDDTGTPGSACASAGGTLTPYHSSALLVASTTQKDDYFFGVYLLENNTVIDALEVSQSITCTAYFAVIPTNPVYASFVCEDGRVWPQPTPTGVWGYNGGLYTFSEMTSTVTPPQWSGSLAGALALPSPPDLRSPGGWFWDPVNSVATEPMHVDDLCLKWRAKDTNNETSGTSVVAGTAALGVQRIDAKGAAFYAPGATRAYGNILTPFGVKTTTMTPTGNLYFAWQRKTGDFTFATSPICYV